MGKSRSICPRLLIAHEVGHALYTPNKWDFLGEIPLSFVNVVEDVRIEKLMKRRYAGLPKTFYNGYRDINAKDFFQLQFADLEEFGLVDRINLFYKVGMFHNIPFKNDQEIAFRDECANVETFDEVLDLASRIAKYQQGNRSRINQPPRPTKKVLRKHHQQNKVAVVKPNLHRKNQQNLRIHRVKRHLPIQLKKTVKSQRRHLMMLPHLHNLMEKVLQVVRHMATTWKQLLIHS